MLEFRVITKKYAENTVVDDVSFAVNAGDFLFVCGESGAGKTQLFKLILREIYPSFGKLLFENKNVYAFGDEELQKYRRNFSIMPQNDYIFEEKTVFEHIELVMRAFGVPSDTILSRAAKLLNMTGLFELAETKARNLSSGERKKLCLCMALANNNRIIIADEPFANLGEKDISHMMNIFIKAHSTGKTVIIFTSRMDLVRKYSAKTVLLENGKVVSYTDAIK